MGGQEIEILAEVGGMVWYISARRSGRPSHQYLDLWLFGPLLLLVRLFLWQLRMVRVLWQAFQESGGLKALVAW